MNVQFIEKNGKPEWAVIPYKEYIKIQELMDDIEDRKDIEKYVQAIENGEEQNIPGEVTFAILEGIHPIRAWREYKQITVRELAKRAGITSSYLSQIETGKRNPTIDTLKSIAEALGIDVEILI
ncbi:MAG: helix-turn-helix transcriptional regulator [Deltaproteobacteria bacterium]|nr:helix-turn-helix transcriptional regulator [Deltaproteobacteria bacterium]MBW2069081.1 helix-turn-helix transcriptional regulator [Deltaproteobacteria bacterium]